MQAHLFLLLSSWAHCQEVSSGFITSLMLPISKLVQANTSKKQSSANMYHCIVHPQHSHEKETSFSWSESYQSTWYFSAATLMDQKLQDLGMGAWLLQQSVLQQQSLYTGACHICEEHCPQCFNHPTYHANLLQRDEFKEGKPSFRAVASVVQKGSHMLTMHQRNSILWTWPVK